MLFRKTLLSSLAIVLASAGTLVALASIKNEGLRIGLMVAFGALVATALVIEWNTYWSEKPKEFNTPEKINRFMHRWISRQGRVVIFSRDMSWVNGTVHETVLERTLRKLHGTAPATIRELLRQKSASDELTICLPNRIPLATELELEGARLFIYESGLVPQSRFTIVRHERADSEVAIGRTIDGIHRIETFASGEHPAFSLALDLVRFAERVSGA